jgi:hypothetical protein
LQQAAIVSTKHACACCQFSTQCFQLLMPCKQHYHKYPHNLA